VLTFLVAVTLIAFVVAVIASVVTWARRHSLEPPGPTVPMGPAWVDHLLPAQPKWAFVSAIVIAGLLGVSLVLLAVLINQRVTGRQAAYGYAIFVLAPFAVGFVAGALTTYRQTPTVWSFVLAGACAPLACGLAFLAAGAEGAVCLFMAMPITVPCSVTGALIAYFVHVQGRARATAMGMMVCLIPLGLMAEPGLMGPPPATTVRSAIEIQAPPSTVWAHLAEFDPIAAPADSWFFRAGVAYPISARLMEAPGVGAMRVCDFSTGRFVETVRVWDEARRLMFTIESGPPVLREWSPYGDIRPPHVQGYFVPQSGDFTLVPLAGGGTRLEGTSVYRNHMWPSHYWRLWSDAIVSRVHRRVFENVKRLAERDSAGLAVTR